MTLLSSLQPLEKEERIDTALLFHAHVSDHLQLTHHLQDGLLPSFTQWVDVCLEALHQGKRLFFFGNGGSAADAQHLAAELVVRFECQRQGLPAIALTTDTSILTAVGNDYGFENLFARQIDALGAEGDVAVALSTSGTSPNILKALKRARLKGLTCVALTGERGRDALTPLTDLLLTVPSSTTARIQEMHILLGHMLCAAIDKTWQNR